MKTDKPIIHHFAINGLHGYKDIRIDFNSPTRVIIAENGSGKTTLLGALSSFLKGNFHELSRINFDSIECALSGSEKPIILNRADLPNIADQSPIPQLQELSKVSGISQADIRSALLSVPDESQMFGHEVLARLYTRVPHDQKTFLKQIAELREIVGQQMGANALETMRLVRKYVENYQILYLPTYRRVELPKVRDRKARAMELEHTYYARSSRQDELHDAIGEIKYGLADVEERLQRLMADIQRQSNIGYRTVTANIIDDALKGSLTEQSLFGQSLPSIEDLSLFFSRVEETRSTRGRLEQLKELYASRAIESADNVFLRYFLGRVAEVLDKTREMESRVEAFVEKANNYLSQATDEKLLRYTANAMKVSVYDQWTNQPMEFDSLSSGEKQVISLMAHMYLGGRQKIVLIDEPELSLSIEWQRRILPDIADAPSCAQLLAITHSPFIFENRLDPDAVPLKISKRKMGGTDVKPH